jgi:preprotein translocase subunit SecD
MKKISTYYFIVFAGINIWLGRLVAQFTHTMAKQYAILFEDAALPAVTQCFVDYQWWPYVFAALFLGAAIASVASTLRSSTLCHGVIAGLTAQCVVLVFAMLAYAVPFVPFVCNGDHQW